MRLSKIKMSGFKSFVDPTTIHFPSNLVGIVGPNGCGKSNIIDAVRWVMGELSAKQLRGDSMADVIFNGSSARKPVSTASIELIFDNSDGAVGGQFSNYSEISVRREVVRDGTSNYFLNNTRCRRRDVTDLFLGTGLGPRSYAIIEQGTITRLVESKPEELRIFLEEAAGISRYKERRRETESRMHHTRENIERLNDLLEEVTKQLQHLDRQAHAAERYKELNDEKRKLEAELKVLYWRELDGQTKSHDHEIREHETKVESALAELRTIESNLEKTRQQHDQASDNLNLVQGQYYELGTVIARLEQSLQHMREQQSRHLKDTKDLEVSRDELQGHIDRDQDQIFHSQKSISELQPAYEAAIHKEQEAAAALENAEQKFHDWQQRWELFNQESGDKSKHADVNRAHIERLERQLEQEIQRRDRLRQERDGLSLDKLQAEILSLKGKLDESNSAYASYQHDLDGIIQNLDRSRADEKSMTEELHAMRSSLEDQRGRFASLEALQQEALGKSRERINQWLKSRHLLDSPRLAELINVDPGWERAVETVLGYNLEAICIDEFEQHAEEFTSLTGGALTFMEKSGHSSNDAGGLLDKVRSPLPLHEFIGSVLTADTQEQALALRSELSEGTSVITRDGIWVGRHWVRVVRDNDERSGVIAREQEIKKQKSILDAMAENVEKLAAKIETSRRRLAELESRRDEVQLKANLAHRRASEAAARMHERETSCEQISQRIKQLQADSLENDQLIESIETELNQIRHHTQITLKSISALEEMRVSLINERDKLQHDVTSTRERTKSDADAAHVIALKLESQRSLLESTRQNLGRMQSQLEQMESRRNGLTQAVEAALEPAKQMEIELKTQLGKRNAIDNELIKARRILEDFAEQVRNLEQQRHTQERMADEIREQLQNLRLGSQETRVRQATLLEQLQQEGHVLGDTLDALPKNADADTWKQKISNTEQRIERLGPINLAAIQEHTQYSERRQYLDSQLTDLNEALTTLANAIRKIDRETRTRFKETFDKVNSGLQTSFPKLFGGGHSYLELTGEELLDAGVTIMARPPGKRNSTIHLLSGGEKALTAVALVFAIFELNPAPFCMLDEVDAPLDEANISRFGDLVRSMMDRVQFVFITHNKGTMEIANQLIGVTMQEPGVSRLVAVDIDEAVRIAAM